MKKYTLLLSIAFSFNALCYSQATKSSLRSDGVVLKNGEPFFPVGYYCEGIGNLSKLKSAADTLSASGFNMMYTEYNALSLTDNGTLFNYCNSKGIYNLVSFYEPKPIIDAPMTNFINMFTSYPSIFMWSVCDDANKVPSDYVIRKNNLAKSLDSDHLTYQSWYATGIDTTVGIIDASAMQTYPIYHSSSRIDRDWDLFKEIVSKCELNGKASIANTQIFCWSGSIWPTAEQADVQTYLALAAGFKGILFYTFKDYRVFPSKMVNITHPELWNVSKNFAREINSTLKNVILNGERSSTGAKPFSRVYFAKWTYNNEEYILAINANTTAQIISVPVAGTNNMSLFPYRNSTLSTSNNTLTGRLNPMEVQIYKINSKADTISPSAPTNLIASSITPDSFVLSWSASYDYNSVVGYDVYKDGILVGSTSTGTSISITGLDTVPTYSMAVVAKDAAGNSSTLSDVLIVSTSTTGINETRISELLISYNPINKILTVSKVPYGARIAIYTLEGKQIKSVENKSGTNIFPVGNWEDGIYIIKVQAKNALITKKVFIKN